jgi:hypothetical protein
MCAKTKTGGHNYRGGTYSRKQSALETAPAVLALSRLQRSQKKIPPFEVKETNF